MKCRFILPVILLIASLFLGYCSKNAGQEDPALFELMSSDRTNITFSNDLSFSQDFNIYRYRNFYNGGGIAVGDINNDGLVDLYFTANMKENRLYLNQGNFQFNDITSKAGVEGERAWSTGVSMVDVNGDGLLDIYVCNSGMVEGDDKRNELFINQGDSTFAEKAAEYGIDDPALSIHANFFDYDHDGDLDMYLVNNSYRAIGSFDQEKNTRSIRDPEGGDKLYRNDGNKFIDVSEQAGIYGSEIGFGLGASVGDVDRDGWEDIYISNDFFERDYLYINNRDGTFSEVLENQINSISAAAMGADIADLNGDGYPEIFVTDMLPEPETRLKQVTTFDSWERYQKYLKDGYYHQFTRNTLQLNNRNGTFSEIGRYAGVEATDWSWGANIADFDLDGHRDIFVANGMLQDITNIDYLKYVSRREVVSKIVSDSTVDFKGLIDIIPSTPVSNYAFRNSGNLQFVNHSEKWGLNAPGFSNGSAYGDLDNDGDLDLVINNLNETASVYQNFATERNKKNQWLSIRLNGQAPNHYAIGSQVTAWADGKQWYAEQVPVRGFQSTVDHRLHFGLGNVSVLDSLGVQWPDGSISKKAEVATNQMLELDMREASTQSRNSLHETSSSRNQKWVDITEISGLDWTHRESEFNDFTRDPLLFHMRSTEGPCLCVGDANGDGLEDFYAGGAKDQPGILYLQRRNGTFSPKGRAIFAADAASEDVTCTWLDADGDGNMDLYVGSGSNEFPASSSALADRLYMNKGKAVFIKAELGVSEWLYKTAGSVSAEDFDEDGDVDLFLGVRLRPFGIGLPVPGYLLENDGSGKFSNVTQQRAPGLGEAGMITGSEWGDVDGDGDPDLVLSGEWMPIKVLENKGGKFALRPVANNKTHEITGWWNTILLDDIDSDGDLDFIAGNHGENSRFKASIKQPVEVWINDFDANGKIEQIIATHKQDTSYVLALRHNLLDQLPYLKSKYPTYKSYAGQSVTDIFTRQQLENSYHRTLAELSSIVGFNDGTGRFEVKTLPMRGQLAPMFAGLALDLTGDEKKEIMMGGNLRNVKPEVGQYASSYGAVFQIKNQYLEEISDQLDFSITGQVRSIKKINMPRYGTAVIIARNDDRLKLFRIKEGD